MQDLLAFYRHYHPWPSSRILPLVERLQARRRLTIRPLNMRDFPVEVLGITAIYNDAWSDNWGFVPITDTEAQHLAQELRLAVIPEMALMAELDGEVVGCFVALPDLNQIFKPMRGHLTPWGLLRFWYQRRRLDTLRIAIMGVKKRQQRLGVGLKAHVWGLKEGGTLGIVRGEAGWILEDNHLMLRALEE